MFPSAVFRLTGLIPIWQGVSKSRQEKVVTTTGDCRFSRDTHRQKRDMDSGAFIFQTHPVEVGEEKCQ